jgi:hypothetical protein
MPTIWRRRLAPVLLVPLLIAAALLAVGGLHLTATAHSGGADAACPASTNWDALTGTCV